MGKKTFQKEGTVARSSRKGGGGTELEHIWKWHLLKLTRIRVLGNK